MAASQKIAFADTDIAQHPFRGGDAGAKTKLAGRFFRYGDCEYGLVGFVALIGFDLDGFKQSQISNLLARSADFSGVERISFDKAEFASHHFVQCPHIADNIYALHVDARPFIYFIDHVDKAIFAVALDSGANIQKRVSEVSNRVRQRLNRIFHLIGVIPFVRLGRDELLEGIRLQVAQVCIDA